MSSQDHLTLIIMTDETSPMRRVRVRRSWIRNGVAAVGFTLVAWTGLSVDYVRLRVERPEVEAIQDKNALQEEELSGLQQRVEDLAGEMDEIRELERKVRIIADLPAKADPAKAVTDEKPSDAKGAESGDSAGGMGGDSGRAELDDIDRLHLRVAPARDSLTELLRRIEAKKERLASMPSIRPTDGWVTSSYGNRVSPFTGRRQFHRGLDIAADYGTEIVAPARGKVVFAGKKGPLGKAVILDHGYGTQTTFGHAKETFVKKGDTVERGTRIASVGSSGRSTGPHLHYAVKVRGKSVDPADFIFE